MAAFYHYSLYRITSCFLQNRFIPSTAYCSSHRYPLPFLQHLFGRPYTWPIKVCGSFCSLTHGRSWHLGFMGVWRQSCCPMVGLVNIIPTVWSIQLPCATTVACTCNCPAALVLSAIILERTCGLAGIAASL